MADDKPAPGAPPDDTAAKRPGPADSLGTMAMTSPSVGAGPPPMPTAATATVTAGPPPMPAGPPPMPAGPPPMPAGPPPMPTAAAVVGLVMPSSLATMPTAAASAAITAGPPAMPAVTAPGGPVTASSPPQIAEISPSASLPTMAATGAEIVHNAPPSLPPARYELGHEIARGGMGRVVDATDTRLGRTVAFKEALTTDGEALRRFEREIRITARLEHPSIVPVHDAGESSRGAPFYVMRKVSGQPLERLVAGAENLGDRLALIPHIVDSAQAIAHAHERGIVHRDIKPSNILVGDLGETVVIDWGLAKAIGEPDEQVVRPLVDLDDTLKTRAGIVYGTPGFMAPEQLRGAPVDERCDVYALGATLYHLLARTPPHHAKTADEMMKAAVAAPPTPIRELVAGVPPDLSTIVDKALAHDPKVRYQNARALAEDLQRFLTGKLVASHHYSPREKLFRFIRKNRGVSAAAALLLVIGTALVIRIVIEKDRADHNAAVAETQRAEAERRAEELTLTQARYNVDVNPTKSITMVKPLATRYWREVRAIAAAARAAGVAWSLPAARETLSLEMSHDGLRAVSAGRDGVVQIHDLVHRTSRAVVDLHTPAMARFADGDRQVVAWHDDRLAVIDVATGRRRDIGVPSPIHDLEVIGATAYWVDRGRALWRLDLAGGAPAEIPVEEPLSTLAPSPDGRWIALGGERHLFLLDRNDPAAITQVTYGVTRELAWSSNTDTLAALVDENVIAIAMVPVPHIVDRQMVGQRLSVAYRAGRMYVLGPTGVGILMRADLANELAASSRRQINGLPVGLTEARGGAMIAGASDGITVISDDGDRLLPLQSARVERVVASPRSPYLLAQLEGRLLLWNLDDIQPRRLSDQAAGHALFADPDRVVTGGTLDVPAQLIDLGTGAAQPLGAWQDLRAVTAAGPGRAIAIVDGARHVHLAVPGREPEDLPGEIDIAGFATDAQLVLATLDGEVVVHDVARGQRSQLLSPRARLIGLAWGRGRHPWIAAALADGTLWRRNLATGATATAPRVPPLDAQHVTVRDSKLLVDPDGSVAFLHDGEIHTWRADGGFERFARAPKPLDELADAGPDHLLAVAADTTLYTIARATGQVTEGLASVAGSSAAMSPDTGLLVAIERGALQILDPLVHQRWTLAPPGGLTFDAPAISADGRHVVAGTAHSLLAWTIELPTTPDATVRWLDAMTNAVDDRSPGSLGWK